MSARDSKGGLEDTNDIESQIFDNTFIPLNLPSPAPSRSGVIDYIVSQGETVQSISSKFNLTMQTVLWANNLTARSRLKEGQMLKILPTDGVLHLVRKGETISSLSLAYRVYTEDIIDANRLSSEGFIVAGETLIIPGARPLPPPASRPRISEKILVDVRGALTNPAPGSHRSQGLHWRNAVDLANSCGGPVAAAAGGEVIKADGAGWNGGFGKYVMLAHAGGFITVYGHLSGILVSPGQQVGQGERIGSLGATGRATGCHVHFEVRGAQNPFAY